MPRPSIRRLLTGKAIRKVPAAVSYKPDPAHAQSAALSPRAMAAPLRQLGLGGVSHIPLTLLG